MDTSVNLESVESLDKYYRELISLRMIPLTEISRDWRERFFDDMLAVSGCAYPEKFDLAIKYRAPYIDVKMTFGDRVIWARFVSTKVKVQLHYNDETTTVSIVAFRKKVRDLLMVR